MLKFAASVCVIYTLVSFMSALFRKREAQKIEDMNYAHTLNKHYVLASLSHRIGKVIC